MEIAGAAYYAYLKAMGIQAWVPRALAPEALAAETHTTPPPEFDSAPSARQAGTAAASERVSALSQVRSLIQAVPGKRTKPPLSAPPAAEAPTEGVRALARAHPDQLENRKLPPREADSFTEEPTVFAPAPPDTALELDWPTLRAQVAACSQCPLHQERRRDIFGAGDEQAELMLIGAAPGEAEEQEGTPFAGRGGQLLDAMLQAIGLGRSQVYLSNLVKCRPPRNRRPVPEEIQTCAPYLQRQVQLLRPRLLVALGDIAARNLLQSPLGLERLRGVCHRYQNLPLYVTYHPAYLLQSPGEKRKAWEDLQRIYQYLNRDFQEKI